MRHLVEVRACKARKTWLQS